MSAFNPFEITAEAPQVEATPVLENAVIPPTPVSVEAEKSEAEIEVTTDGKPPKGFNKDGSPRKERSKNPPIPKELKAQMIRRYANETPSEIAASLGLEHRQVYNVIRNSRILLETALTTETDPVKLKLIQEKLDLIPHKEAFGSTGGPRVNTLSIDDILGMV
jgi:transposase-like protein